MHDLLTDLCLREYKKQKFAYVVGEGSIKNIPHNIDSIRRIFVAKNTPKAKVLPFFESASLLRCLWWFKGDPIPLSSVCSPLLRGVVVGGVTHPEDFVQKVNLRIINLRELDRLPSMSRFWDLQTLWVFDDISCLVEDLNRIWIMSQLRSFLAKKTRLPNPPSGEMDCNIILENLHALLGVQNFECSKEIIKRIPRVKTLSLHYMEVEGSFDVDYNLNNLGRLQRFHYLDIVVDIQGNKTLNRNCNITFSSSLTRLSLLGTSLCWDDVINKIGSLPHLQILGLLKDSCIGDKWETVEGQFCSLIHLKIFSCSKLEFWIMEGTHFPHLKFISLLFWYNLKEIPSSIGDILTLEMIKLELCCRSLDSFARRIKEEQEELGNEDLRVEINEIRI